MDISKDKKIYELKIKFCSYFSKIFLILMNKFNIILKYCFLRSIYKESVKKECDEQEKNRQVGEKIRAKDNDVYDVISEPINTLNRIKSEKKEIEFMLNDCEDYLKKIVLHLINDEVEEAKKIANIVIFKKNIRL